MDKKELERLLEASYNDGKRDGLKLEKEKHTQEIAMLTERFRVEIEHARQQADAEATKRERDASVIAQREAREYGISVGKEGSEKREKQAYDRGKVEGVRQGREEMKTPA